MISLLQASLMVIGLVAIIFASIMLGAYLMFKGKAGPGEGFIKQPKGAVFTIPEAGSAPDYPEEDKKLLDRTEKFLSMLNGGK